MGLPSKSGLNLYEKYKKGKKNLITDVKGVKIGNITLQKENINTGVTVIFPHEGNIFQDKVMAATYILNGFGKSIGLLQIEELGTIETPIIMTNTLSVGTAATALTKYMLEQNKDIGVTTGTVNCLVTECNDSRLNDIRGLHVTEEDVLKALNSPLEDFEEGAVGSGTGMCCLGVKGGIGSSSRLIDVDGKEFTIGALVMSNFGSSGNLIIGCNHIGKKIKEIQDEDKDQGSIIIIIGTDIPLSERQLKRVAKRSAISLGRTGSYMGNGSGDIAIAFTTTNRVPHYSDKDIIETKMFFDDNIDKVFEASVEAVEEAIISSLYHAKTTVGYLNKKVKGLRDYL
ncbi:D-aminopeptidase [Sedimentibacter acidaminivorans]|uniref:D-aminopeptidase n=1 Tax=Sedimentibacter acidaminivorans TaxID=913099 RepID=A0ABS4GF47_9FIRM|nr:P1 family peptidase [Sedimentibacter acidaminivorans]MBP1926316.1 D-aminopeptidase [Sedimentibacter acidaminivorans]